MPTTRITEKLSTLVASQLPEFIQSDFTTFKTFLEAYYEFLEQDQNAQELLQNSRSYSDIDRTIDSFIEYFLKQYSNDIPRDVLYNKKALVKNIQDLYVNRGNEKSYKLLFRILFNKDVEVFYPSTQVLKASDGKWIQRNSFFMRTLVGSGTAVVNNNVIVESSTSKYPVLIKSRKLAFSVAGASSIIHEYFFDNSKNIPIEVGNIIEYEGFKGEVVGTPVSATITSPGTGFKIGDILPLTSGQGVSSKLKVTKVNSTGGILNVQFINFGIGYTGDFYNSFSASLGTVAPTTFSFSGGTASISDRLSGFVERGTITAPSYSSETYFAEDYQGDILSEFFTNTSLTVTTSGQPVGGVTSSLGLASDAAIYVSIGSKARYPGYYEANDGFLSDDIYIQDQDYYQSFSYVLKIDERLDLYKKAVLDILHPAGMKLFGDLTLNTSIDLSTEITATIRFLVNNFQDIFGAKDDGDAKDISKSLDDASSTDEFVAKDITKISADDFLLEDLNSILISPTYDDSTGTLDDNIAKDVSKQVGDVGAFPYTTPGYFAEDYTSLDYEHIIIIEDNIAIVQVRELANVFGASDALTVAYTKVSSDSSGVIDSLVATTTKNLSNSASTSELVTVNYSKPVTSTLSLAETVGIAVINNTSDSLTANDTGIVSLQDYAESYFAEDYTGLVIQTF
jgi:hypothetical protein